jgi:hypothetical protein
MNWPPLILGILAGAPAVVLTMRGKAARTCALLAGFATLCVIAGVPPLRALVHRHYGVGAVLAAVLAVLLVAVFFFWLDIVRGEHKAPLMGRKGGGAPAAGGGGGKQNHHIRPMATCVTLGIVGLMAAANLATITPTVGHGFTDLWSSTTSNGGS